LKLTVFDRNVNNKDLIIFPLWDRKITKAGVDPTKLFFFASEELFCFSLVSLRFCYIQKKVNDSKMT